MTTPTLHVEVVPLGEGEAELRYWRSNRNEHEAERLPLDAELRDLLRQAERDYYTAAPADLLLQGRRLYRWLDTPRRLLTRSLLDFRGQKAVALCIDARGRLAHLPWELLHDDQSFLVDAINPAILPVRWQPSARAVAAPANRALSMLFMATSPEEVEPVLDFEAEEAQILESCQRFPIGLRVEESGNLGELAFVIKEHGPGAFDVLHLTGHATHTREGPRFITESLTGSRVDASAKAIAEALVHRPELVFLSGCRTGEAMERGAVQSLAAELNECGVHAVLSWGRPVLDSAATVLGAALYGELAAGMALVPAVVRAIAKLRENAEASRARDWHLLRLFVVGAIPGALVTPQQTSGRKRAPRVSHATRFLGTDRRLKVPTRESFVGRRRPLQRLLGRLRTPESGQVGVVIHGLGGVGKTSVVSRLCDRMPNHFPVFVFGPCDEPALIRALMSSLLDLGKKEAEPLASSLRDQSDLSWRLASFLRSWSEINGGSPELLFVLDDYEQNFEPLMPEAQGEALRLRRDAVEVLEALLRAMDAFDGAVPPKILITSRYALPEPFRGRFHHESLGGLRGVECRKKVRQLEAVGKGENASLLDLQRRVIEASDGNPRLLEWLFKVLAQRQVDVASLLQQLDAVALEFREKILAEALVKSLSGLTRTLLADLLVFRIPVPYAAIGALREDLTNSSVMPLLEEAIGLGLLERERMDATDHYRVPRLLEAVLVETVVQHRASKELAAKAIEALVPLWWNEGARSSEERTLELHRLALLAGARELATTIARSQGKLWNDASRFREAQSLLKTTLERLGDDHILLILLARAEHVLGDVALAEELIARATKVCPTEDEAASALVKGDLADILASRGQLDEALRIRLEEQIPIYERLGDVQALAVTKGQVADILASRGQLDEPQTTSKTAENVSDI